MARAVRRRKVDCVSHGNAHSRGLNWLENKNERLLCVLPGTWHAVVVG